MSILLIEGDLEELGCLSNELHKRNYLGRTLRSEIVTIPELDCDQWNDFLYQLRYLIKHYITCTEEDSE